MNEWDERMNEQTNEHNGKMFIDSSDIMKNREQKLSIIFISSILTCLNKHLAFIYLPYHI